MNLVFIPDPNVHSHEVAFPISFVVSEEKSSRDQDLNFSGIPPVVVYDNSSYETQFDKSVNFEAKTSINGHLQVKCRADLDGTVSLAIKEALTAFSPNFAVYTVVAEFTLTPQS